MSQLRQRARKVKAAGAAERRNWNPSPGSSHYKVYKWWQRKSGKRVPMENFCHYWRVVVIWAPLRWLAKPLLVLLCLALVAGIVTLGVMQFAATLGVVLAFAMIAYVAFGVRVTGQLLYELNNDEFSGTKWHWLDEQDMSVKAALIFAAFPIELAAAALALTVGSLIVFFVSLHDDYDLYGRIGRWFVGAHFSDRKSLTWIRPWLSIPIALGVLSVWYEAPRVILVWLGGICVIVGVVLTLAYFADLISERRKARALEAKLAEEVRQFEAKKAVTRLILRRLFAIQHPEWVGNDYRYQNWLERYERYCMSYWEMDVYGLSAYRHLRYVTKRYTELYGRFEDVAPDIEPVEVEVREPGKLQRFAVGTADFFVLIWSIVLTKKWKICPIVEIPE